MAHLDVRVLKLACNVFRSRLQQCTNTHTDSLHSCKGVHQTPLKRLVEHAGPFALTGAVTRYLAIGGASCLSCSPLRTSHVRSMCKETVA